MGTEVCIRMSCFLGNAMLWLFRAVWFCPYILRAVRLKLIWGMQRHYYNEEDMTEDTLQSVLKPGRKSNI